MIQAGGSEDSACDGSVTLGGKSWWRLRHAREMPATFGWQIRGFVTFPGA